MKTRTLLAALLLLAFVCGALAAPPPGPEKGSFAWAEATVKRAAALYREKGARAAFQAYRTPAAQFYTNTVYLVVLDNKGKILYHGIGENLTGMDLSGMKDEDGRMIVQLLLERSKVENSGVFTYRWRNGKTGVVEGKKMVFEVADDALITATLTEK